MVIGVIQISVGYYVSEADGNCKELKYPITIHLNTHTEQQPNGSSLYAKCY